MNNGKRLTYFITILALLALLAMAWRWSSLSQWLDIDQAVLLVRHTGQHLGPLLALGCIMAGCVLTVPLTVVAIVTILAFGAVWGTLYVLVGATLGGVVSFSVGRWLGREAIEGLAGHKLQRWDRQLARHGFLTVAATRFVPIAPFAIVNMILGVSAIQPRDFVLGTLVGMTPGTLMIAVFVERFVMFLKNPSSGGGLLLFIWIVFFGLAFWYVKCWVRSVSGDE